MVDLSPHIAGINAAIIRSKENLSVDDPRSAFMDLMVSQGFSMTKGLSAGNLVRIDGPNDKKGKESGWFIYNEYETMGSVVAYASYGDWKTGFEDKWTSKRSSMLTDAERGQIHIMQQKARERADVDKALRNSEAAEKSKHIISKAPNATNHEYLTSKKVSSSDGLKLSSDNRLIVPMKHNEDIVGIQFISSNGEKRFLKGSKSKGAWFRIDGDGSTIFVTEGYSTARSIHEATGNTVYVCFSAGNIYEVTGYVKSKHSQSSIIIAGDDDTSTSANAGRTKAEQAADGLGVSVTFPPQGGDFNDYHVKYSIDALKELLRPKINKEDIYVKPEKVIDDIKRPIGVMGAIFDYFNATSGGKTYGYALQTAISVTSAVLSRSYRTNFNNYSSLYLISVGATTTGKEHIIETNNAILRAAGMDELIAGDGYTSSAAVLSTLIAKPRHLASIDELGRYLEASQSVKGDSNRREANTKLMEAFGRCGGVIYPMNYSTMTTKKDDSKSIKNRLVYNPAITISGSTTPETFFKTIDMSSVKDGFINRFIIHISDAKRRIREHKEPIDVPECIIDWIETVTNRYGRTHVQGSESDPIIITFSKESMETVKEFQWYCLDLANKLDKYSLAELTGRSAEQSMRLSLICALSENPMTETIENRHVEWAIWWVKKCLNETIESLKVSISSSDYEGNKKKVLKDIRKRGEEGVTWAEMQEQLPYSEFKNKELKSILSSLKDADSIIDEQAKTKRGRPTVRWVALK